MLPATRNATETITIQSIRNIEHRDAEGNIIGKRIRLQRPSYTTDALAADPDVSNPTRPRMERPLDTIRSFEAAIDGSYSRRASSRPGQLIYLIGRCAFADSMCVIESTNALCPQTSRRSGFFPGKILWCFLPVPFFHYYTRGIFRVNLTVITHRPRVVHLASASIITLTEAGLFYGRSHALLICSRSS